MSILQDFTNDNKTQNQEIQVFIIKQFERGDKEDFENKYSKYINGNNIFLQSNISDALDSFISSSGRQNYLIPLIYDKNKKDDIILQEHKLSNNLYYYTDKYIENANDVQMISIDNGKKKYYKYKINNYYYFSKYSFLLECPLLDYTKLSYVYQIKHNNMLGIGNVTAVNTSFNVNSSSNCTITFTCGDNDEINKEMFDTNDIVIVKILKSNKDLNLLNNKDKESINIFEQEFNKYQNIFTGYIDNVNYTINFGGLSKTLNLVCSGPTKKMLFTRIISGQASADIADITASLNPISVYSFPQTLGSNNEAQLDNESIVKNIVIRTLCDIDSIPEIKEAKLNIEYYFNKNAIAVTKDSQTYQDLHKYKNQYNAAINTHFDDFIDYGDTYIQINKNSIYDSTFDTGLQLHGYSTIQLPIMMIKGTKQPAYQMTFNTFTNTFITQYDTLFQFIRKIANTLDFCFYDDADGIIHFETYNTSLNHLYNLDDANHLKNIISFTENQNTNEMYNIILTSSLGTIQGLPDSAEYGIYSLIRDEKSIKKLGERFLNAGSVTGLYSTLDRIKDRINDPNTNIIDEMYKKPLTTYSRCLMQRINSKALSQISVQMTGNPMIKFGKYAYIKQLQKLFYIDSIRHTWSTTSFYTNDITGIYTRDIICSVDDINNGSYNLFKSLFTIPNSRKNGKTSRFLYAQQQLNNKLDKESKSGNIIKTIEDLFNKIDIYNKIKQELKNKFYYDDDNFLELIYSKNNNYAFTFLDGYFWTIPVQNDAYNLAIEQKEINKYRNLMPFTNLFSNSKLSL